MDSENTKSDSTITRLFWAVIAIAGILAVYAIVGARDLVYDGSYYLLGIASHGEFQLFEPARVNVQLLQQGFAVAGARLGIDDLWTLGRLFSLGTSGWPVVLTGLCWFALPRGEKCWIVGPLLNLALAVPATSFIGIGEGVIASCLLWLAFLFTAFRTNHPMGAVAALVATGACAFAHESAVLFLALLAALAALRVAETKGFTRIILLAIAVVAAASALNMLHWIVFPRSTVERGDFLVSMMGGFLGTLQAPNIPAIASLVAACAILAAISYRGRIAYPAALGAVVIFAVLLLMLLARPDELIAPSRFFAARGLPVAFSTILAAGFLVLRQRGLAPQMFVRGPVLVILAGLVVMQMSAQAILTARWNAYVEDMRSLVSARMGVISHADAIEALDPGSARFRRELLESWSVEPLSIVLAPKGRVTAVIVPAPEARWVPFRFDDPRTLPRAPELDWSRFRPR